MRLSTITIVSLASAVLAERGYVHLPLQRDVVPRSKLARRQDGTLDEGIDLAINASVYWLNLTVGTPPQSFRLQLDTGSSDLWLPAANATACIEQSGGCPGGDFNINSSSTAQVTVPLEFAISYGDGTGVAGDYFTDVITVGTDTIPAGTMALGLAVVTQDGPVVVNDGHGLVGVCYASLQSCFPNVCDASSLPPTLPQALVQTGAINREAYSLYLNNEAVEGTILFGGVDTSKYTGDLVALPILPVVDSNGNSSYSRFNVAWTTLTITYENQSIPITNDSFAVPANIDSGTVAQFLPKSVVDGLGSVLGGTANSDGIYYVPCNYHGLDGSLTYSFGGEGGPSIDVPFGEFIDVWDGQTILDDGNQGCQVLANPTTDDVILGDVFMRSGYFVYDLENNILAMAQARLNVTDEKITAIPSGQTLPGVTSTNTFTDVTVPAAATSAEQPGAQTTAANPTGSLSQGTPSLTGLLTATGGTATSSATGTSASNGSSSNGPSGSSGKMAWSALAGLSCAVLAFILP